LNCGVRRRRRRDSSSFINRVADTSIQNTLDRCPTLLEIKRLNLPKYGRGLLRSKKRLPVLGEGPTNILGRLEFTLIECFVGTDHTVNVLSIWGTDMPPDYLSKRRRWMLAIKLPPNHYFYARLL
jgi:hypothetical protein